VPDAVPSATPAPEELAAEDAPQAELVQSAPQALAERLLSQDPDRDLPMPPSEDVAALGTGLLGDPEAAAAVTGEEAAADLPPAAPGPRPMNRPGNLVVARTQPAPAAPRPASEAAAAVAGVAAAPTAQAAAAAPGEVTGLGKGTRLVQLGVFDSEAITRKAWEQLAAKYPDLLGSKNLYVERTTANARVFYRLRVAGFGSSDQTRQMCEALRARGVDCIPVTLQ
jgi:hypothetical protein